MSLTEVSEIYNRMEDAEGRLMDLVTELQDIIDDYMADDSDEFLNGDQYLLGQDEADEVAKEENEKLRIRQQKAKPSPLVGWGLPIDPATGEPYIPIRPATYKTRK